MGGARTRTMAHLAKMLALAATSCSHEQAEPQAVTLPTPSATASASATATTMKAPPPDDDTTPLVRHPMHGSDPVGPPPPQYCASVAQAARATATMQHGPNGFDVEVRVTLGSNATFAPSHASSQVQAVQAYGAIPLSATITATQAVVRARLNMLADKATVRILLPITCPPGSGALDVFLSYDRTAGTVKVDHIESR